MLKCLFPWRPSFASISSDKFCIGRYHLSWSWCPWPFEYHFYFTLQFYYNDIHKKNDTKWKKNLYITKSWSVAFNVATLRLSHISCHVITIFFPEFVLQFKNSFYKFKNPNKKKIIINSISFIVTILDGNRLCSMITIWNSNPLCSTVTINDNPLAS